jgi:hypothetical protein
MGAFYFQINSITDVKALKIKNVFSERGFCNPTIFKREKYTFCYYPKLNGNNQLYQTCEGDTLFVCGTLWYNNKSFSLAKSIILEELKNNILNYNLVRGSFCLVFLPGDIQKNAVVIHDAKGIYRFYSNKEGGIVSSSWLSIVKPQDRVNWDIDAIRENLILGFNIGENTFDSKIKRVLSSGNLPTDIIYIRKDDTTFIKPTQFDNRKKGISASIEMLENTLKPKILSMQTNLLGLSSGYDSRLLLSVLKDGLSDRVDFFSFYKPNDNDLIISKEIGRKLNKEIKILVKEPEDYKQNHEQIYHKAFLFFDGQIIDMIHYSKPDYTREFRNELIGDHELHLSGVGGEIFRNYSHDHLFMVKTEDWINSQFLKGNREKRSEIFHLSVKNTASKINELINIGNGEISYIQRKQFYGNITLRDWHGVRNTTENQYSNYYSPFTDTDLITLSYKTIKFQGFGGRFEADMIRNSSLELAKIKSDYGHNFNFIPYKIRSINFAKCLVKHPQLSFIRSLKPQRINIHSLSPYEKYLEVKGNALLKQLDLPENFITQKKEQILAILHIAEELV